MNRFTPTALAVIGLILAALLLVAVTMFSNVALKRVRIDLTEDKLFTLSEATKQVLDEIDEPVTLNFFFSKELGDRSPPLAVYAHRVEELLDQYSRLAGDKIRLEKFHPIPFSDQEDLAVSAGIRGLPYTAQGDLGFFGLEGRNATDDTRVIDFFSPERERFLEYDLTQAIYALANPEKKKIGLMTRLPLEGMQGMGAGPGAMQPWAIYTQLKDLFDVKSVSVNATEIPADIDILMVVHPSNMPDQTVYAIDQFILKGGKAMIFVDPYSELEGAQRSPGGSPPLANSEIYLDPLYKAWGVEVVPGQVAGDIQNAARVDMGQGTRGSFSQYVVWLNLTRYNFNPDDAATLNLESLSLGTAGIIERKNDSKATVSPLIVTSPASQKIDVNRVRFRPDPVKLLNEFEPSGAPLILGARISGAFDTAFPDGPPPIAKPDNIDEETFKVRLEERRTKQVKRSDGAVSVVLIADTDFLADPFWLSGGGEQGGGTPVADNGAFVANLAETLAGREDLIGLRGRGTSLRPFHLIDDLEREAEQRFRSEEQTLAKKLRDAQEEMQRLQGQGGEDTGEHIMSESERESLEKLRNEVLATRKELRRVQADLRRDVNEVGMIARFANIAAVPIVVALIALVLAFVRRVRRARRAAAQE